MRQEVLETALYPEIVYECSRVTASGGGDRYWEALNGELTLHGVTRSLPILARVSLDGNKLRALGEFKLQQKDYGIAPVPAAAGTIRVKDELRFTFGYCGSAAVIPTLPISQIVWCAASATSVNVAWTRS